MKKTLNDVFRFYPNMTVENGIFHYIAERHPPWEDVIESLPLDIDYFGRSGGKTVAPLIERVTAHHPEIEYLEVSDMRSLATIIMIRYGTNWAKMWETMSFDYDPIENYRMEEEMTDDETVTQYGKHTTRTDNLTHGKTGTESLQHGMTATRTDNLSHTKTGTDKIDKSITEDDTNTGIYGFNSSQAVPSDVTEHSQTGSETTTYNTTDRDTGTQTDAHSGTDTTTYNTTDRDTGTQDVSDSGTDTSTRNYKLTRSGNVGVTTSQQMIQSERDLWIWNFFNDVVYPDIDKTLALKTYQYEEV